MCEQLRWRHRAVGGMARGECRPDEEPGRSFLWEVSFGFGKRCTCGEEGEGSCDMGAGEIYRAREGATYQDISI